MDTSTFPAGAPDKPILPHALGDRCVMPPHPDLLDRMLSGVAESASSLGDLGGWLRLAEPRSVGLNDGLIYPGTLYPLGTTARVAQRGALERSPLRGTVRVIVVLVDFSDREMAQSQQHFRDLFFSTGVLPNGSVKEYYTEVTGGLVSIAGDVVGPLRMPHPLAYYAGTGSGMQNTSPNARDMAHDAVAAADSQVNFGPYDNDGNGFVDAFIVVHAGPGAEVTGASGDIWSHKWVLPSAYNADGTQVYGYLTIPEDARIGVCCHELGHLLFGWPDLYDTDYSSAGIGNWCLMAGGSWGGDGDMPCHPSAWCKVNQGWVTVSAPTTNATLTITDVNSSKQVYRLWKDGTSGNEHYLVENRQQVGYDRSLPGSGLLVWHIDDAVAGNANEAHPQVALLQADGNKDLEHNRNRGDAGDPYPGSSGNTSLTKSSNPGTLSYAGSDTCVSLTEISPSAPSMTARVTVSCVVVKSRLRKEIIKDKEVRKDIWKDGKEGKELQKEVKEFKDREGGWRWGKLLTDSGWGRSGQGEQPGGGGQGSYGPGGGGQPGGADEGDLESRVAALEAVIGSVLDSLSGAGDQQGQDPGRAFIGPEERPDLSTSALAGEDDEQQLRDAMAQGGIQGTHAKRQFDHGLGR